MTCKNCIHFTNELVANKYHRCDAYLSIGGVDGDGWTVLPDNNACKLFECDECESIYNSWESVSK